MGHPASYFDRFHPHVIVGAFLYQQIFLCLIPDGGLDVQKCPCSHTKSTFNTITTLISMDGLCLGDICFAKIQMNLHMRTVSIAVLESWVASGCFNPERMPADDHSRSTAILIILTPNKQGTSLMYMSIGLIVRQRMGPVGQIEDIPKLIAYTRSQLRGDRPSSLNTCKMYCIIIGDYGGPMGFATELPFCTAYPLSFADRDD